MGVLNPYPDVSTMIVLSYRKQSLATKDYDNWWSMRSKNPSGTKIKLAFKKSNENTSKDSSQVGTSLCKTNVPKRLGLVSTIAKSSEKIDQASATEKTHLDSSKAIRVAIAFEDKVEGVDGGEFEKALVRRTSKAKKTPLHIPVATHPPAGQDASESSNEDRHWNRLKKKQKISNIENISINSSFFADTPISQMSPRELTKHLNHLEIPMECLRDNSSSKQDATNKDIIMNKEDGGDTVDSPDFPKPMSGKVNNGPASSQQKEEPPKNRNIGLVSEFHGQRVIKSHRTKYIHGLWKELNDQILGTPVEHISSLEDCARDILQEIARIDSTGALSLENSLNDLFSKAKEYDSSRSSSWEKMSREEHVTLLSDAKKHLSTVEAEMEEATKHLQDIEERLLSIEGKKKTLLKELESLEQQSTEILPTLEQACEKIKQLEVKAAKAHDEVASVEKIDHLSDDAVADLENKKHILETSRIAITDIKFDI